MWSLRGTKTRLVKCLNLFSHVSVYSIVSVYILYGLAPCELANSAFGDSTSVFFFCLIKNGLNICCFRLLCGFKCKRDLVTRHECKFSVAVLLEQKMRDEEPIVKVVFTLSCRDFPRFIIYYNLHTLTKLQPHHHIRFDTLCICITTIS